MGASHFGRNILSLTTEVAAMRTKAASAASSNSSLATTGFACIAEAPRCGEPQSSTNLSRIDLLNGSSQPGAYSDPRRDIYVFGSVGLTTGFTFLGMFQYLRQKA